MVNGDEKQMKQKDEVKEHQSLLNSVKIDLEVPDFAVFWKNWNEII